MADPGNHRHSQSTPERTSSLDHVLLRDLLCVDPDARQRYADLKRENVDLAQGDIDVYVASKARFVAELLTRARAERGLEPANYWLPDIPRVTLR